MSVASLELPLGIIFVLFGTGYGSFHWLKGLKSNMWTDPTTVDISCSHDEACSKASGLTPPRWL
jgi:hypothetical protein